ncbi:hypothetical protein F53441_10542 [Fusarium austroafricanum]|uniref:WW domain-containing protein n=1 Tax=Fusarium austroafricanum TaxID=2364996 RepID=A0A8H4KAA6_9HYPO|nr:hypothetical protein F53441_10542 [Fusarium austroafricanum]
MSTSNLPTAEAPVGGDGRPLPPGWLANWSPEHNAWYYVFPATGATQWAFPVSEPEPQQHLTPNNTEGGEANQPLGDGDRGLGKTAVALGGSFLAGSYIHNKFGKHHEHQGQHDKLGKVAQSMAIAGAGAVGAKIMGLFGNKQQQQPVVQTATHTHTQTHFYPVYVPGPQASPQPSYYGQYPPGDSNNAHTPTGGAVGVVPGMQSPVLPHQTGGMPMPLQSPSPMGSFPSHSGPPLHIYGAVFADKDVTQIVRSLVTPQQTLQVKGESLVQQFGDPWPEAERKMFNVLYSYGDRPMELIAADTTTTNIEIKHEAISKKRMEFCQPPPSRIIAGVWGYENALTRARIESLEKDGELDGTGETLGAGGFWGWEPKTPRSSLFFQPYPASHNNLQTLTTMSNQPNRNAAALDVHDLNGKTSKLALQYDGKPQGQSQTKSSESNGQAMSNEKQPGLEEGEIAESDSGDKDKDAAKSTTSRNFPITQLPNVSQLTTSDEAKLWMQQVQTEVRIKGSYKRFDNYPK